MTWIAFILSAQAEPNIDTSFRLNIRPMFLSNPDYNAETDDSIGFVQQGVRANFKGTWQGMVLKASFQDVRTWGTEQTVASSSDPSAGLHEGYFQFGTADNKTLWARVGRQEYDHNQGRFFWRAGWAIPGRAFDAIRIHNESGNLSGDLIGMVWKNAENHSETECLDVEDSVEGSENLCALTKTTTSKSAGDLVFVAAGEARVSEQLTAQPYVISFIDGPDSAAEDLMHHYTPGIRLTGYLNELISYDVEGAYQTGKADAETTHAAWLAAARMDYKNGPVAAHVLYEEHSGDGDPNDDVNNDFESFLGARHRYRGFADQTGGMNLRDLSAGAGYQLNDFIGFTAAYHYFQLSNPEGSWVNSRIQVIGTPDQGNEDPNIGHEVDLVATWTPVKGLKLRFSNAVFIPLGIGKELAGNDAYNSTFVWMTAER